MQGEGFTREERQQLVDAYIKSMARVSAPIFATLTDDELGFEYDEQERLLAEYAENLPFVPICRCPKCGTVLEFPLDPYGFDGPWWMAGSVWEYPDPVGCEHFVVVLGATNLHDRNPLEARPWSKVLPGPGAPFVVPAMLAVDGVEAVLSTLTMAHDDAAYLVAYFSDGPLEESDLHQPWAREMLDIKDADGEYIGWTISTASWSFELPEFIAAGKLHWVAPNDAELTLVSQGECPYVGLPGVQQPQVIEEGVLWLDDLPADQEVDPFD